MNSLFVRESAVISQSPAADYSAKTGYLVGLAGGTATVSASGTVPVDGVIVEGGKDINSKVTVAVLGAVAGTLRMKAGGAITNGDRVAQNTDGTVITDPGPGTARVVVGIALEDGVSGDLIEVAPVAPMILP